MRAILFTAALALGGALLGFALLTARSDAPGRPQSVTLPGTPEPMAAQTATELQGQPIELEAPSSDERLGLEGADNPAEQAATALRLQVKDAANDQPVRRFWVKRSGLGAMESPNRAITSDPETGAAALPGDAWTDPAQTAEFLVSSPLHTPTTVALAPPVGTTGVETVTLPRAAALVGVVRDGTSAPLPAARVTLQYLGSQDSAAALSASSSVGQPAQPLPASYAGPTLRRTSDDGAFAFGQLPPGLFQIVVERDGVTRTSGPLTVSPGRWTLADQWLDEHVRLAVSITDPDGALAPRTRILLLSFTGDVPPGFEALLTASDTLPDGCQVAATRYTDEEGSAVLGPLNEGSYGLYIQSDAGISAPATFTVSNNGPSILQRHFALTKRPSSPSSTQD